MKLNCILKSIYPPITLRLILEEILFVISRVINGHEKFQVPHKSLFITYKCRLHPSSSSDCKLYFQLQHLGSFFPGSVALVFCDKYFLFVTWVEVSRATKEDLTGQLLGF